MAFRYCWHHLFIAASFLSAPPAATNLCMPLEAQHYYQQNVFRIRSYAPLGTLSRSSRPKEGGQPGLWVEDAGGVDWLLKGDTDYPELQTAAEVIAAAIYRYLGYKAPEVVIITYEGRRYAAVRSLGASLVPSALQEGINDPKFRQLRAFAAYLKDWDRLREPPNNALLASGAYALFDFGGTLGSRAGGEPKPGVVYSEAVGSFGARESYEEILSDYRVDWLPPEHPWRQELGRADLHEIARKFSYLTDEALDMIVEGAQFSDPADARYMKAALRHRRDAMIAGVRQELMRATPKIVRTHHGLTSTSVPPKAFNGPVFEWLHAEAMAHADTLKAVSEREFTIVSNYVMQGLWQFLPSYLYGLDRYIASSGHSTPISDALKEEAREAVQVVDRLMTTVEDLPVGLRLFRGKTIAKPRSPLAVGEGYRENAYLPTSIDEEVARAFIQKGLKRSPDAAVTAVLTVYEVMTPGVKGLYIPAAFQVRDPKSLVNREKEILLDRGLYLRGLGHKAEVYMGHDVIVERVGIYR